MRPHARSKSRPLCCAAQCQGHAALQCGILGAPSPGAVTAPAGCSPASAVSAECYRDIWGSPSCTQLTPSCCLQGTVGVCWVCHGCSDGCPEGCEEQHGANGCAPLNHSCCLVLRTSLQSSPDLWIFGLGSSTRTVYDHCVCQGARRKQGWHQIPHKAHNHVPQTQNTTPPQSAFCEVRAGCKQLKERGEKAGQHLQADPHSAWKRKTVLEHLVHRQNLQGVFRENPKV